MAVDKHRDSEYILRIRRTTRNMHLDFPNRTNRMMGLSIQWIRIVLHIPNTPLLQTEREKERQSTERRYEWMRIGRRLEY